MYYSWLCSKLNIGSSCKYMRLLNKLFNTDFVCVMDRDQNRVEDGLELRQIFTEETGMPCGVNRPCSVLELMISCAMHVERFMTTAEFKDRTNIWFWDMITSLGLRSFTDVNYDETQINYILSRFMGRTYEPNGVGGLFVVNGPDDMRTIEIWYQLVRHVNDITPRLSF